MNSDRTLQRRFLQRFGNRIRCYLVYYDDIKNHKFSWAELFQLYFFHINNRFWTNQSQYYVEWKFSWWCIYPNKIVVFCNAILCRCFTTVPHPLQDRIIIMMVELHPEMLVKIHQTTHTLTRQKTSLLITQRIATFRQIALIYTPSLIY